MKLETISSGELRDRLGRIKNHLRHVPIFLELDEPITIVGDLHGNLGVFGRVSIIADSLSPRRLFLGDVVDRGTNSIEMLVSILDSWANGEETFMLRGNHETREVNSRWGFKAEMVQKYGEEGLELWELANQAMDLLPVAALLQNQYLAVHGGIGPSLSSISEIKKLNKEMSSAMEELMWNDPGKSDQKELFAPNEYRSRGQTFSSEAAERFCGENEILAIIRGHQCVSEGFQWMDNKRVLTIFPLPNYEARGNKAAICQIRNGNLNIEPL